MMLEKCISEYRKVIEIIRGGKKKNSCMMVYVNVDVANLACPSTTQHPTSGIIPARLPHLPPTLCRGDSEAPA